VLLQWRYQPPSRASWATIAANVIDAYIVDNKPSLFHVSIDWIRESFKHNEWMNEEDFEVGENGKKKPGVSPCPIYIYIYCPLWIGFWLSCHQFLQGVRFFGTNQAMLRIKQNLPAISRKRGEAPIPRVGKGLPGFGIERAVLP
jgi:hypothetical protein